MRVAKSARLGGAYFEIGDPLQAEANRMETQGKRILRLNLGNPAQFGFLPPEEIVREVAANIGRAHGYSDSRGLPPAREAVRRRYEGRGVRDIDLDRVYLGNGVSELAATALQALLNDGDEVLIPSPDYPLWTVGVGLSGGSAVHYRCVESENWAPDLEHVESLVTPRTRAIVLINPNNPTGAVYSRELLLGVAEIARRHELIVFADEIYDGIVFDGREHVTFASLAPDLLCLTFSGLSKACRVPGFRVGWLVMTGPTKSAAGYILGLERLLAMRLCANVPGQLAVQAALASDYDIPALVSPGGRLHDQRDHAWRLLNEIPGVSCVKPAGSVFAFPRIDTEVYGISDDNRFAMDLLLDRRVLVVPGTSLAWPTPDHFRMVILPRVPELDEAIGSIGSFLSGLSLVPAAR
jgi:alanine-synthesizing transaminase